MQSAAVRLSAKCYKRTSKNLTLTKRKPRDIARGFVSEMCATEVLIEPVIDSETHDVVGKVGLLQPRSLWGRQAYGGGPYYRDQYRERYYDYDDRRYYRGGQGYPPSRYRTWNGCQRDWTVQDGLCKPYRGF